MSIVKNFIVPFLTTKLFTVKNNKLSVIGLVVCSSLTTSFLLPELSDTILQQSASVAQAQQAQNSVSNQVIQLVNQARSQGRVCGNQRFNAASPLSANASLNNAAQVHSSDMARTRKMSHTGSNGSSMGQRATQAGYQWRAIAENVAAGQKSPSEVVQAWLKSPGHCANIMNSNYNEGGVSAVRGGDGVLYWTMMYGGRSNVAPPTRSNVTPPAPVSVSNDQVIQLINQARSQGRVCGNQRFNAASPLSVNASLNSAAQVHSSDMAARRRISHTGSNGSSLGQRATQAGYKWRAIAENVAAGQKSPSEVVQAWLKSPGHCANIMNSNYNEGGVSAVQGNDGVLYWTMMYGRR